MNTKICGNCKLDLPVSEFKMRKKPPIRLYAWCNSCSGILMPRAKPSFRSEMRELREKGKEMRVLSDEQITAGIASRLAGKTVAVVASEYNVSKTTIARWCKVPA